MCIGLYEDFIVILLPSSIIDIKVNLIGLVVLGRIRPVPTFTHCVDI